MMAETRQSVYLNQSHYEARIAQIQQRLDGQELEGLLLLNASNIMWACGFFHIPNERPLGLYIPTVGSPLFLVPFLEQENVGSNWIEDVRCYWEFPGKVLPEVWMLQQIGSNQISSDRIAIDGVGHGTFLAMQAVKPALQLDRYRGRDALY